MQELMQELLPPVPRVTSAPLLLFPAQPQLESVSNTVPSFAQVLFQPRSRAKVNRPWHAEITGLGEETLFTACPPPLHPSHLALPLRAHIEDYLLSL
jgi:hypothetical protein